MVKYLMDARTQAKIEVHGSDYGEELLRLVPPEQLMQRYGGTNPAPLRWVGGSAWPRLAPWGWQESWAPGNAAQAWKR
jgi:hypothetical protein